MLHLLVPVAEESPQQELPNHLGALPGSTFVAPRDNLLTLSIELIEDIPAGIYRQT